MQTRSSWRVAWCHDGHVMRRRCAPALTPCARCIWCRCVSGDPTVYGNLKAPSVLVDTIAASLLYVTDWLLVLSLWGACAARVCRSRKAGVLCCPPFWGVLPCCGVGTHLARSFKHNGYQHSAGSPAARAAVAQRFSIPDQAPLTENVSALRCICRRVVVASPLVPCHVQVCICCR